MRIIVKVPATSANLGPGFDALGLALDLWNEAEFVPDDKFSLRIQGEGVDRLAQNEKNLIVRSMRKIYDATGRRMPSLSIRCLNRIPLASGLGSSAAAILTGLLGANALLESPLSQQDILNLATEIEGHPDNVASALLGGLVVSTLEGNQVLARKLSIQPFFITIVLPDFNLPTQQARAALPKQVVLKDAVHNISRAVLVTEAVRTGELELLGKATQDSLHQPYRLPLIPGAQAAMDSMLRAGASAVTLSGAGPSLIAFSSKQETAIGEAAKRAFVEAGLNARVYKLQVSRRGAEVHIV